MAVPLLDLQIQNLALENELGAAFARVLRSGQFILGPELLQFEQRLARLAGVRHAIGVSSGTDALLLALMTLGIGPGDEVICPAQTFFATAGCIARVGARPVFAEVCPFCFNLDVADAARRITPRTKALMPVHLFGQAAAMDAVLNLAQQHSLAVIEDAAQSLGALYRGRPVGSLGTFGAFSFYPSKNLSGFGDGGLLVTQDDALAHHARILRVHGGERRYYHRYIGANFRMDALQAALLAVKLDHYADYNQRRQSNAAYYTEQFKRLPGVTLAGPFDSACLRAAKSGESKSSALNSVPSGVPSGVPSDASQRPSAVEIRLPAAYPHNEAIWNQYTLRVRDHSAPLAQGCPSSSPPAVSVRDRLQAFLESRQIGSAVYYPVPLHRQECFAAFETAQVSLPVSEALATECLSLPIYPELTRSQQDEVVAAIAEFMEGGLPEPT